MNTASPPPVSSPRKRRFGLMKVRVESNHVIEITGPDGRKRRAQVTARARSRFPDAKTVVICTGCRHRGNTAHEYPDEKTMIAAHPTKGVMRKNEEIHLYYWWSNSPDPEKLEALKEDKAFASLSKEEQTARVKALPVIGMLTEDDEEDGE